MQPDFTKLKPVGQQPNFSTLKQFETPEEVGGFQSFAQSVAKPFLKIASSARSIGDIAGADSNAEVDAARTKQYDYGYFGKVAGLQNPIESIGAGAEIGSYALGGGGAVKTLITGLKGKVLQGAYQGLKTGAVSSGAMSFGQALQEAEVKPSDVAYKTLFGTALGAGAGLTLGAIAPVIVKGISGAKNTIKRFTNVNEINTELQNLNTQAFKPTPRQAEKWSTQGKDPMKTYTEIFGTDIPEVGKDNQFTRESISDAVQRVDDIYKPAAEGFNTILKNSPEVNSLSKARDMAIKNLDEFSLTPDSYNRAVTKIDNEFNAIKNEATKTGKLLGDDSIPVAYSDNLKDRFWSATKNFGTEDATIANSVNSSIGHGFKDSIENSIQDINVKNYNKQLGDLIVLRDFLETKAGALAGTGGKATRLMSRVAGAVIGGQGGAIGSFLGTITGDKLAQVLINPAYQPYRWLINKKLQQLPQAQVLKLTQEANAVIESMLQKRMSRLALPEGAKLGTTGNPIITPNTMGTPNQVMPSTKSAVAISSQPQRVSATIEPTTKPTTIVPSNANIDKSVPNNQVNVKGISGSQNAFGGVAGIEIKKDENGKTTVNFNPEKALAGIAGVTFAQRVVKLQPIAKKFLDTKPSYKLLRVLKSAVKYIDDKILPNNWEGDGNTYMKNVRTLLNRQGVDSFNMTDRKIADFIDVVMDKANEVPKFKQNPVTGSPAINQSWSKLQKENPDLFDKGILRKSIEPSGAKGVIPKEVHSVQGKWQNYGEFDEISADKIYKRIDSGSFKGEYEDKFGNAIRDKNGNVLQDVYDDATGEWIKPMVSNKELRNELLAEFSTKEGKRYLNEVINALPKNSDGTITAYRIGKIGGGEVQSYTLSEGMAKTFSNQGTSVLPAGTPGLPTKGYKDFGALPANMVIINPKGIRAWSPYDAEILVEPKYVNKK